MNKSARLGQKLNYIRIPSPASTLNPQIGYMKKCSKCLLDKELIDFYNKRVAVCKVCHRAICKQRYKNRKESILQGRKEYYVQNRDVILQKVKDYNKINRTKRTAYHLKYKKRRKTQDIDFRLRELLRDRLCKALKGDYKTGSAVRDLGCSIAFLRQYLESQFQSGMTWANYGKWQIDHIKPLANFDLADRNQLLQAVHYTNLQPLWSEENLKKSNKEIAS